MKVSEIKDEEISSLTNAQKEEIVYLKDDFGHTADVGIVLGSGEEVLLGRAQAALKAYNEGRIKYILPTGKPDLTVRGETMREYLYIKKYLLQNGVPEEVIIDEPEAMTTQENMIYAALRIQRKLDFENVKSVMIITSKSHCKRSLMLAEEYLPKHLKIYAESSDTECEKRGQWQNYPYFAERMSTEIWLMKRLILSGQAEDIIF